KRGGSRENDVLLERRLEQLWPLRQRRAKELITGQKHHHELGTVLELRPVVLTGELPHPGLNLLPVTLQRNLPRLVSDRLERLQVGVERRFDVDHEIARL